MPPSLCSKACRPLPHPPSPRLRRTRGERAIQYCVRARWQGPGGSLCFRTTINRRIRMALRQILALAALAVGRGTPAFALQAVQVEGTWRNPAGGTCDAPFFKSGDGSKSGRGETAIRATIINAGMTITGDLVLEGMRRGQFVSPETD